MTNVDLGSLKTHLASRPRHATNRPILYRPKALAAILADQRLPLDAEAYKRWGFLFQGVGILVNPPQRPR